MYQNLLYNQVVRFDFLPNALVPVRDQFLLKLGLFSAMALAVAIIATLFYEQLRKELPDQI